MLSIWKRMGGFLDLLLKFMPHEAAARRTRTNRWKAIASQLSDDQTHATVPSVRAAMHRLKRLRDIFADSSDPNHEMVRRELGAKVEKYDDTIDPCVLRRQAAVRSRENSEEMAEEEKEYEVVPASKSIDAKCHERRSARLAKKRLHSEIQRTMPPFDVRLMNRFIELEATMHEERRMILESQREVRMLMAPFVHRLTQSDGEIKKEWFKRKM